MALSNAILKNGATLGTTGGTDMAYTPTGSQIPNGVELVDTVTSDARVRRKITCSSRMSQYDASLAVWSKDKRDIRVVHPKILANGDVSFRLIRIIIEEHPEASEAERAALEADAAQVLFDSDFTNFRRQGSLA